MAVIPNKESRPRIVCAGAFVDVCIPDPSDYPFLIALRNTKSIRRWFLDDRAIDFDSGIDWLVRRESRNDDVLLLVRHRNRNMNLGSIGWSKLNQEEGCMDLGRLALDPTAIRKLVRSGEPRSVVRNLAIDACLALRDYVFHRFKIQVITTCYKADNITSAKINRACGMSPCPAPEDAGPNLLYQRLTRADWERLVRQEP